MQNLRIVPARLRQRRKSILTTAILPVALLFLGLPSSTSADSIFTIGDPILGGRFDLNTNQFQIGLVGTAAGVNNWPDGESPIHVIDGVGQKYLNFAETFTGFLVQPSFNGGNGAVATSMQLWTANDGPERDPASYEVWGTNDTLSFGDMAFNMSAFTKVANGALSLPASRNGGGAAALNPVNSQTVTFSNLNGYKNYLVLFPTVKLDTANSMQIAEVQLFGIAAFTSLSWTGSNSNIWNINSTQNWSVGGSPSTYSDTNGVTFDDLATGPTNITVQAAAGVKPAGVLFTNATKAYTLGGDAIVSPGAFTMNGTGSVTLNNANTYSGGITINGGALTVGATGSLLNSPVFVNNPNTGTGTVVSLTFSSPQVIGSLSGTVAIPATGANTTLINLNGDLTVTQTGGGTYAGSITGTGGLIKAGAAILTLTGSNSYSGPTSIVAGTLASSTPGGGAQGALPAGQPVTISPNATLLFGTDEGAGYFTGMVSSITADSATITSADNTRSTLPPLTLVGATLAAGGRGTFFNGQFANYVLDGNVTTQTSATTSTISAQSITLRKDPTDSGVSSAVTFDVARGTAAVDLDIRSVVRDLGAGLSKTGNGILALNNSSFYTGPTLINGGTVIAGYSEALGVGTVTISNGSTLVLQSPPTITNFAGFTLNGGATLDGSNTLLTLTDNLGNQSRSAFYPTRVGFSQGFNASFVYTAGGNRAADGITFTIQNNNPNVIGGGGGGLGYTGMPNSAALQFNIYTGGGQPVGTAVGAGTTGPYTASAPVNLGGGNPIKIDVSYDPGTLVVTETLTDLVTNDTYSNTFPGIDLPTIIGSGVGYVGFTGATGGATATQTVTNFSYGSSTPGITLSNAMAIPAGATAGLQIQSHSTTPTSVAQLKGALSIGANGRINVSGPATVSNAPYNLTLGGTTSITGDVTIDVANDGTGLGHVIANEPIVQSGLGSLTKSGNGTLTIASISTYQGTTTVNGGTLRVTGSLSGSGTVVNNTATLTGDGTVTGVTVATGGTLAPGNNGIGSLATGPLILANGSTLALELGSFASDQVLVNGAGTLAGTVALALTLTSDPGDFLTFTILDGTAPLVGFAAGARFSYLGASLAQDQVFTVNDGGFSQVFQISYTADSGRDVTLTTVPEPTSAALLGLGLLAPVALRRRRLLHR